MRHFVILAFCVVVRADVIKIGLPVSIDGVLAIREPIGSVKYLSNEDPNAGARIAEFGREHGVGLRDNEEVVTSEDNFVYPCGCDKTGYDYECIRKFFAKNSDCSPVRGQVPDPLVLPQYTAFFPSVNMTGTYSNISFEGLSNATICTFYYNNKTGNLVFAIKIPVIYTRSPRAYFTFRRPCRENIVTSGAIKANFRSLIFTAIIPLVYPFGKLRLDLADISPYIRNPIPEDTLAPSLTNSTNPVVVAQLQSLSDNFPIITRELYLYRSQLFTAIYIQKNICDFGIKLYAI